MHADPAGGPSEQARHRIGWRRAARGADESCVTCRHMLWVDGPATAPRCRQMEHHYQADRDVPPPDHQRYVATQVSAVCDLYAPQPAQETAQQRLHRLRRQSCDLRLTAQQRADAAHELTYLEASHD